MSASLTLFTGNELVTLSCNKGFPTWEGIHDVSLLQFCVIPLSDSITKDRRRICGPMSWEV